MEILDNQGLFADVEEKSVRDKLMPWLYTEVFENLKKHQKIERFVDKQIDMVSTSNISSHKTIVAAENERKRLAKVEEDRQNFERSERRRIKLEMKLKRRENRRLHSLEKIFIDTYLPTADIDKDLINVSDLDGSDSTGMKSAGFRGGLLGEIYLLLKKFQRLEAYQRINAEWEGYPALLQNFWQRFVGEGWSVTIGLDQAFDNNASRRVEGATLDKIDLEFIRGLSPEDFNTIATQIKAHFINNWFDETFPGLPERRAKKILKVRFVEQTEAEDKKLDEADDEAAQAAKEVAASQPKKKKKKRPAAGSGTVSEVKDTPAEGSPANKNATKKTGPPPEEVDPDPVYQQLDKFITKTLDIILDEKYGLKNIKFTKFVPKRMEEKKEDAPQDDGTQAVQIPRLLTLFVPERPAVEEIPINLTQGKFCDSQRQFRWTRRKARSRLGSKFWYFTFFKHASPTKRRSCSYKPYSSCWKSCCCSTSTTGA